MPIFDRIEKDMFRFAGVCRHMVCPVSTEYRVSGGLIQAFVDQDPTIKDKYKDLCDEKALVVGKPQCFRTSTSHLWDTVFLPMKTYADDTAKYKDVRRNIEELRKWLLLPEHQHTTIGIPMLGCEGGGPDPYNRVREMLHLYLDPLKATVFLSSSPQKLNYEPQYLVIVGPKNMTKSPEGKERVEKGILRVLEKWGKSLSDFDAVVSGTETSTDRFITGPLEGGPELKTCFAARHGAKKIIPVPVNWEEDKTLALPRHRMTLAEIGARFILIMPENANNNRAIWLNTYIREANEKLRVLNRKEKIVTILGRADSKLVDDSPLNIE